MELLPTIKQKDTPTVVRIPPAPPCLGYEARDELRVELVTIIVKILDAYLISAILIVFSLGLYELFVGKLDAAEGSETSSRLLYVRSLDDLKNKVVKLILLILAIECFQHALHLRYDNSRPPLPRGRRPAHQRDFLPDRDERRRRRQSLRPRRTCSRPLK